MLWQLLKFWVRFAPILLLLGCGSPAATPTANAPPTAATAPPTDAHVLRLGSTSWVPFTGAEGQPRVASYLVESALERAGFKAQTTIVPDGTLTPALENGRFDGSDALWPSKEREQFLLYSKPYLENRLLLVGRKGSDVSAKSFAELRGKRVAIVEGYAYGPELDSAREPLFVRVQSAQENLRAVVSGKADYCLLDALLVEFLFEQYPKEAPERLEVGSTPLIRRTLHFAVRKALPNAARIIEAFNEAVGAMAGDGSYNRALQLAWLAADIDGDGRPELVPQGPLVGPAPPTRSYRIFEPSNAPGTPSLVRQEEQGYYVNGRTYSSWQEIPDSLKLQPGANPVGAGHPQIKLIEW